MSSKIVEYNSQRVLLTIQLAESYGTDSDHINDNYQNNKSRFREGKHYFELRGVELREFKASQKISGNLKYAPVLQLWTEKGAWLHAKSLNTDEAWEAYELLVDEYYNIRGVVSATPSYMIEDPEKRALMWIEEHRQKKELEEQKLLLEQKVAEDASKVSYLETILRSTGTVTTSQIAKDYGLTAQELNRILHEEGIQYKINGQWLLYRDHDNKGYTQSFTIDIVRSDGRPDVKMNTQWTQKGRKFIHEVLSRRGIKANIDKEYFDAK